MGHVMLSLGNLFLENNHLNGSIPTSLCQCQLQNLDLSNNNLSGEIPNCWKDNQELSEIKLSSNKLTGAFPSSFGNLSSLVWLHLNNNSLQGEIPASFINLKKLLILDLGENQLSGSIPSSWEANTFPFLQVLRLRQNMLNGSIPSQLCQLKSLKILDLSRNKLQGSIPQCIGNLEGMKLEKSLLSSPPSSNIANSCQLVGGKHSNCTALAYRSEWSDQVVTEVVKGVELEYTKILKLVVNMDLSQNNLIGFIPNEITLLTGLHSLNFSKNQLKGEIPQLIGDMKSLESLDMSQNELSGTIPNTMSALTSLSRLNLSHNNLSGPIPKDNQFSTFNDPSSYAYNPHLCGSPLPNMCPGDISHKTFETKGDRDEDEVEKVWFYFVIALGFMCGLWGVIGTLWFKKNWRHAYFRWVEDVADKIYVAVVIEVPKIKKKMMRNHVHE
ncbi:receptor protein EIX2 [Trifolium repens]|nr:receptor protein EIX2 [Trifolium repens]